MFWSSKSNNAASLGAVSFRTVGSSSRCLSARRNSLDGYLLGAIPLTFLSLLVMGRPALSQSTGGMAGLPGSVTVTPGGTSTVRQGLSVAVVSATDAGGNVDMARRALMVANSAITRWPGYVAIPPATVAGALRNVNAQGGLTAVNYMALGKRLKANRLMAITLLPGPQSESSSTYTAIAEVYDTKTGGIVGRGQAPFTATPDNATGDAGTAAATGANAGTGANTADGLRQRSVESAVVAAIVALNEPAALRGVVVSIPDAYQARISAGERQGLRNGAQIEYLANGQPIAYGTVIEVDAGTAVATIAAEAAVPSIMVNTEFRTVTNPPVGKAGATMRQIDEREWKKFQQEFAIAAIPALAYQYYMFGF